MKRRIAAQVACWIAVTTSFEGAARADETANEPAHQDGFSACSEFQQKADAEFAVWARDQPKVPYSMPKDETWLGAPWVPLTRALGNSAGLLAATFLPSVGAQLRDNAPALTLSFPWSFGVGPALSCTREQGSFVVKRHVPNRFLLEPAIVALSGSQAGMWLRPGYRLLVHPSTWAVGFGGGIGTTIDLFGLNEPVRASLSPEVVVHFGHCCDHGYFSLTFRTDIFFAGRDRAVVGGNLGYNYF